VELAIRSNAGLVELVMAASDDAVRLLPIFAGGGGRGSLPVPTKRCSILTLVFQVTSVALQAATLELLEHLGRSNDRSWSLMRSASPR